MMVVALPFSDRMVRGLSIPMFSLYVPSCTMMVSPAAEALIAACIDCPEYTCEVAAWIGVADMAIGTRERSMHNTTVR